MTSYKIRYSDELYHHGIKGQKWGVRRFQNEDGTYTESGKKRRAQDGSSEKKKFTLSDKQKKALKIGAAVAVAAVAAYGGHKLAEKLIQINTDNTYEEVADMLSSSATTKLSNLMSENQSSFIHRLRNSKLADDQTEKIDRARLKVSRQLLESAARKQRDFYERDSVLLTRRSKDPKIKEARSSVRSKIDADVEKKRRLYDQALRRYNASKAAQSISDTAHKQGVKTLFNMISESDKNVSSSQANRFMSSRTRKHYADSVNKLSDAESALLDNLIKEIDDKWNI